MKYVLTFALEMLNLLNAMSPYLLLGFFIAGMLKVWFPQRWINRYMGKSNVGSVINTALLGIPLPLCSCGVIPTGISFYKNGASKGSSVSFLISTPQTGVDSVMVTYSLLGLPFAIIRVIVALITGVAGGIFTNSLSKNEPVNTFGVGSACKTSAPKTKHGLYRVFHYGFYEFLMDIAKWLLVGLLIAGALAVIIPDNFFAQYLHNEPLSMLTVLVASVPLYICATASVPIAAVLMLKGLSPGAALVLLMAGPATNAATITVIKKVFGSKTLTGYLASIILGAMLFGIAINTFLPREWFALSSDTMQHMHHHELLPEWFRLASTITLLGLIANGYMRRWLNKRKKVSTNSSAIQAYVLFNAPAGESAPIINNLSFTIPMQLKTVKLKVTGMTCSHCKASVEENVKQLSGINSVNADPGKNTVVINGSEFNLDEVIKTINGLGYEYQETLS
ncbi:heavy metal-associated domain-containing protein [Marinilabiliaceae bacterium JC017]|nr:heavy metal-associated domain-containing protein [Marinilabiliaceae bacterium JC017]